MEVFNREKVNIGNEKIPPIIQISTDFYIDNLRITIKSVLICVICGEPESRINERKYKESIAVGFRCPEDR